MYCRFQPNPFSLTSVQSSSPSASLSFSHSPAERRKQSNSVISRGVKLRTFPQYGHKMLALSVSCYSVYNCKQLHPLKSTISHQVRACCRVSNRLQQLHEQRRLTSVAYNPFRSLVMGKKRNGFGPVCYSTQFTPRNLQWVSTVCTAILMLAKGTAIHKSFLVPLFALQAPASIVSWMKGEYGIWTAFLALLVRLFFFIPGELELPFITLLLVIVSPYQIVRLRGTQEGVILSLAIAAYVAFQHFTRAGTLGKAFDQGSIFATLATICVVAVPCLLLIS